MKRTERIRFLTVTGVLTALATVLYFVLPEIPLVPGVPYLKIDLSDLPALLAGLTVSPLSGVLVEVIKNLLHLTKTTTFGVGEAVNVGIGSVLTVSLCGFSRLFGKRLSRGRWHPRAYLPAAVLTAVLTIAAGWLLNAALTPVFLLVSGLPITGATVWAGVVASTALNAVKAGILLFPFYPFYAAADRAFAKISR